MSVVTLRTRQAFNALLATALLGCAAGALAQAGNPATGGVDAAAPAPSSSSPAAAPAATAAPATQAAGGIRSQNIFDVKPEASADPNYLNQTNGERNKVQPGNNAPMWRQVSGGVTGYSSLPVSEAPEAGNLIQGFVQYPGSRFTNAGEAWRQVRNNWIIPYGAALLFVTLLALAIFYFTRGPIRLHGTETGRKIERFTPFERATHWSNAIAFVTLALSGIVMAFGKFFLLPVLGSALFGYLAYVLKTVHNFVGPLFVVTTLFMIFTFIRSNWPGKEDFTWLRHGGGLFGGKEPASHRFNAGEKLVFWGGVLFLGSIVIASGLFLDKLLPGFVYTRGEMQVAHMVHAVATLFMMAMIMGHIYIGTLGMTGAYKAMREGYVDETWAREHHRLWYDDIEAGKIPAQRSSQPEAPPEPARPATAQGTSA
ncbi:formate dehydrogenase subunit gamma [Variovorax boronicumulans]|uniref:Formate dehydrogenase subunit gamma n=1 Tax=Variovorax boronicumulans TaxID=436515 RepID=A0AAW8D3R9_9BURK|nr:formate dehydrogenase subunit gamma [Variovorax boronicumulans]MDP9897205.1 formate dehydrogenase subunit gamma [Variovorax boronicumulans]MDQ0057246.1 formate dehydrogenase subunit gamma [Variovorax boronicumulans]